MGNIIRLMNCANSFLANTIKGRLQSEGIKCFLKNENFNVLYGLSNPPTGIDLMIDEEDLAKAMTVLSEDEE